MAIKPLRLGARHGNKVYYAPISVSGRRVEKSTYTRNPRLAWRFAKPLKSDGVPLSMKRERIQSPEAAAITGLSLWNLQSMAARGEIPGAAKLGSRWTFNEAKLRRWITHREAEACRRIDTSGVARGTGDFGYTGMSLDEAYERALGLDPKRKRIRRR